MSQINSFVYRMFFPEGSRRAGVPQNVPYASFQKVENTVFSSIRAEGELITHLSPISQKGCEQIEFQNRIVLFNALPGSLETSHF